MSSRSHQVHILYEHYLAFVAKAAIYDINVLRVCEGLILDNAVHEDMTDAEYDFHTKAIALLRSRTE